MLMAGRLHYLVEKQAGRWLQLEKGGMLLKKSLIVIRLFVFLTTNKGGRKDAAV
jgi:hypothetical protein